jgi:DnaK suppressor protein
MATKANANAGTKGKPKREAVKESCKETCKESKEAMEQYRKMLLKRREELAESVKNHAEELPETGTGGSSGDIADQADSDYTTEMFGVLLERQAGTLEEVERALNKMDRGEFGICEGCEKSIPTKRLKALPWARYCLECQEKADRVGAFKRSQAAQTEWETVDE